MKKKIMFVGLALLTLGAVSCKKDYVCDCHVDYAADHNHEGEDHDHSGHESGNHADIEFEYSSVSKGDAEDMCAEQQSTFSADMEIEEVNCELK
jgi:hypothetical protein